MTDIRPPRLLRGLPLGVWALGFVSLFMDLSSELVHALLPLYLSTVLGASMLTIGVIEGVAEAAAAVTKVFSGVLSDYIGKRKLLTVLGYGLAAFTKPIFPLATSVGWVFTARFIDRIGKGIRGAPRDALIADMVAPPLRGAAFGLRQSLDSIGAFLGPLLAVGLMILLGNDINAVLWVAVIPAFIAVVLLLAGVQERAGTEPRAEKGRGLRLRDAQRLRAAYWRTVLLGAVFTLARFSEAFLILRAQQIGVALAHAPLVMIAMNVVYAAVAYPAGMLSDRLNPHRLLLAGLLVLVGADLLLAQAALPWEVYAGAALWGLHMGLTQGIFARLVADTAPPDLRGSAFGIFNLLTGLAILMASVIAGVLWDRVGPGATFAAGAGFAGLAAVGLLGTGRSLAKLRQM